MEVTTAEQRRALKDAMPQTALHPVHTGQCRLLPDRCHLLDVLPKAATVAEIGVAFGDFSNEILNRTAPGKLHLIDAWGTDRYRDGLARIRNRYSGAIESGRIEIHQGLSTDVLAEFPSTYFDWVYIDTNHTYATTLEEMRLCRARLKPGGRIAGHDFCTGNIVSAVPYGVVEAVAQFCIEDGWEFEYLALDPSGHFSFCIRPIKCSSPSPAADIEVLAVPPAT